MMTETGKGNHMYCGMAITEMIGLRQRKRKKDIEEVGDRDRWRDDDRDREGKPHVLRDGHYRDDRFKAKEKEERYRGSRHKDDKKSEDKLSRSDKYKEEIQTNEKPRSDRLKDDKPKEDRQREERIRDSKLRDEKYRDPRSKDDKCKPERSRDDKLDDNQRDVKRKEDRYRQERHRDSHHRDDKPKTENHKVEQVSLERTKDYQITRQYRDEPRHRAADQESMHYESDQECNSYSYEKYQRSHRTDCSGPQFSRVAVQHRSASSHTVKASASVLNVQQKNVADTDSWNNREQKRFKNMQHEIEQKDNATVGEKSGFSIDKAYAQAYGHQTVLSKEDAPSGRKDNSDRHSDSSRECSPAGSTNSSLRSNESWRSPSPYARDWSRWSHERTHKRRLSDSDRVLSRAPFKRTDARRSEDHVGSSGKLRSREATDFSKDSDYHRGRSKSKDRGFSSHQHDSKYDRLSRASSVTGSQEDAGGDYYSKRSFQSTHDSVSVEGPKSHIYTDKMKSHKSGWTMYGQNNKSSGPSLQQRASGFPVRPSGHLPPPPPFRPGIDNPAIVGPSNNNFEDGSRDQTRSDWNARNWNSQPQIPGSSNMFVPFHRQAGGHPSTPFQNMGQRHPGMPFFRGMRPPSDIGHGVPYPIWDNGDATPGHNGVFGWQRQHDEICGVPYQGSYHPWDGYTDEHFVYGRRDWYSFGQGMGVRGWERPTDTTKGQKMDASLSNIQNDCSSFHQDNMVGTQEVHDCHEKHLEMPCTHKINAKSSNQIVQNEISEISKIASFAEVMKSCRHANKDINYYLSKIDISARLADPDIYNQCSKIVGMTSSESLDNAKLQEGETSEERQIKGDLEAEKLLSSLDLRRAFFPVLSENHVRRVQKHYQKTQEHANNHTLEHANNHTSMASTQETETIIASSSQFEPKKEASCGSDLLLVCDSSTKNPALSDDGEDNGASPTKAFDLIKESVVGLEPERGDDLSYVDEPVSVACHSVTTDGDSTLQSLEEDHDESTNSFLGVNACMQCQMGQLLGTSEQCTRCQTGNQQSADLSCKILVNQCEMQEATMIATEQASKFDLHDSKGKIKDHQMPYTLPECID
eukprot:TRINITY_DN4943_c0_g2_i1.p1 TRINITY_DN4943_c0_g2~~TRINITY_DN4943_c0_g2_i1.p1  ORF type:complete len:1089 (-),score=284.17 TRINITY_DN4943_c0_g2_i1:29-3295(-)